MAKTYRALGVVAMVILLGLIVETIIIVNTPSQVTPDTFALAPAGSAAYVLLSGAWLVTLKVVAAIISTFAVIVAGQSRQWVWLAILLVVGLIGVYGTLPLFFVSPPAIVGASITTNAIINNLTYLIIPPAIPTLVALVFAALHLRADSSIQGVAVQRA